MTPINTLNTIGLLGGMSWESSLLYYQQINQHIRVALGGLHSAPIILDSVDFSIIAAWQQTNEWDKASIYLSQRAQKLEAAGASCVAIATNTMHKVYDAIASSVSVPVLHIAQPTIAALHDAGIQRIAFLGTRYSMTEDFIRSRFAQAGIDVLVPEATDCDCIHNVIFDELCQGLVRRHSKHQYQHIVSKLTQQGAQGVVLGCTEIGLLLTQNDVDVPLFDTTALHTRALADVVLHGTQPINTLQQ
ncbi:aspartate/glutamate racemase family protein [Hydromonas duriensis]|uniref:Aspartate racemase n=1 Tax=Hydromonas duriensis TaxID=1527608 RepID=A0A4R6Y964_9BURK|nr:aspartate/glutamate racemase family protein [Hydromonas duriensis]TDR31991.1 aspartate racemase [Hydromonas duriensis]